MTEQIFIQATRENVTVPTSKGNLTPQQLWQLPVESARNLSLDAIYQELDAEREKTRGRSLVNSKTTANALLDLQVAMVKYIAETKMAEATLNEEQKAKQSRKAELEQMLRTAETKKLVDDPDAIRAELAKLS